MVGSPGDGLDMMVAATIRSAHYERLQTRPELAGVDTEVFAELKPMPSEQFKEVICGPPERATETGRPGAATSTWWIGCSRTAKMAPTPCRCCR